MAPLATTTDVTNLVDTDLTGVEIEPWLELTAREINRAYDSSDFEDTDHQKDLEAALTAYRIISGLDRRPSRVSVESSTISFDQSESSFLKGLASRLEPGSELVAAGGVTRYSKRNFGSANNPRDDSRITRADRNPDEDLDDAIDETPYD